MIANKLLLRHSFPVLFTVIPYILITLTLVCIYIFLATLMPHRVGDGAEYYALFYAWSDTFRPWMSTASFSAYELFFSEHSVVGLVSREALVNAFPALRLGDTADFNHFWFYSFLAFIVSKFLALFGLPHGAHQSFLALHFFLTLSIFLTAFYLYKWRGLLAVILMTLASPILWFFDKVHTELFTYSIVLLAILFLYDKRYLAGAFMLAIASTQNPSFALLAFVPFFYRIVIKRKKEFNVIELMLTVGTVLAVLVHPVYYFFRFGVMTPQLLAGGAALGGNLSTFYIWLIDPDVGLMPNWPLGCLFVLAAILMYFARRKSEPTTSQLPASRRDNRFFYFFLLIFFLVNFYAHSSTTNINSGATLDVARYSLWYLPAFFPLIYYVLKEYPRKSVFFCVGVFIVLLIGMLSVVVNDPKKNESYTKPTRLSAFIQTKASFLYNPPDEVFAERYSGKGESIHLINPRGILGPDCKKLLVYTGLEKTAMVIPPHCHLDASKLLTMADYLIMQPQNQNKGAFYARLDKESVDAMSISSSPGEYFVGQFKNGNFILGSGWSGLEADGVWSEGKEAKLSLPCSENQFYVKQKELAVSLYLQPFGQQDIEILYLGKTVYKGTLKESKNINFVITLDKCQKDSIEFSINIVNPKSPFELRQSEDARKLGVWLSKFSIH